DGVEPILLEAGSQIARMSLGLPRLLRRRRPALGHFQYAVPLRSHGRSVITVHDLSFEGGSALMPFRDRLVFRAAVRRSLRRADAVLTVSEFTRRELRRRYGLSDDLVYVTHNGVDPAFWSDPAAGADGTTQPRSSPRPEEYVLFVGALQVRKDPVAAVEALALIPGGPRLLMAGPDKGARRQVIDTAQRLGVADRVELLGHVERPMLHRLYREAACLVFPSRYEGFGLPVVEAMASGTPVVATSSAAIPEVAGDAAILVEAGDTPALAGGIERAIADRERLIPAGIRRARSFTWRSTAERTAAVYRRVLELPGP
ncbi:MAG: glycosyltransferase family 4 protein, partial [Gaiellales bacterium]